MVVSVRDTDAFQKYTVPCVKKLSQIERKEVDHYRSLREKIHDGPFYTVLAGSLCGKQGTPSRAQFDPFQGMATYGQKYLKETRTLPKLNSRPYGASIPTGDYGSVLMIILGF